MRMKLLRTAVTINDNLDSGNFMFKFMIWMTVITTVGFIILMIFDYK